MFASLAVLHWPPLPLLLRGQSSCKGVGKLEQTSLPVRGPPGRAVAEKPIPALVAVGEVRWLCRMSQEEGGGWRGSLTLWLLLLYLFGHFIKDCFPL